MIHGLQDKLAVQMAAAVSVDLHGLHACGSDAPCVVVGLQIALDDSHLELGGEIRQGALEQGGLAGTRGRDEVEGQNAPNAFAHHLGQLFVGLKHIAHHGNLHIVLLACCSQDARPCVVLILVWDGVKIWGLALTYSPSIQSTCISLPARTL